MIEKTNARAKTREPLSKERVLLAAVRIADEEGIAALSMRRLGQALGVEAMSLYKHVTNKDDLLAGIVDIVAAEIELPAIGGDWQASLRRRAVSAHEVLMRHPWATILIVSRASGATTAGNAALRAQDEGHAPRPLRSARSARHARHRAANNR